MIKRKKDPFQPLASALLESTGCRASAPPRFPGEVPFQPSGCKDEWEGEKHRRKKKNVIDGKWKDNLKLKVHSIRKKCKTKPNVKLNEVGKECRPWRVTPVTNGEILGQVLEIPRYPSRNSQGIIHGKMYFFSLY